MTVAAALPRHRQWQVSRLLDLYSQIGTALLFAGFLLWLWTSYRQGDFDAMEISGYVTFFVSVLVSFRMRARFRRLIEGLIASGAIVVTRDRDAFDAAIRRRVVWWTLPIMLGLSAVMLVMYHRIVPNNKWWDTVGAVWAASVAGERYGRLIAYALAPRFISGLGGRLRINFWHPDNAGGLLPFAQFYNYAGLLAAVTPAWLLFWLFAIQRPGSFSDYRQWTSGLAVLWLITMALFILSFVFPVWLIHRRMAERKDQSLKKLHWMPRALSDLHDQMEAAPDDVAASAIYTRLTSIKNEFGTASGVSVWPVDNWVLSRFTITTAANVLGPFVLNGMLGTPIDLPAVFKSIAGG